MSSQVAYRLDNGTPVTMDAAHAIWTAVAREVLGESLSASGVTQSELARQVQQRSGVYTRMPPSEWLLTVVANLDDAALTARLRADPSPARSRAKTSTARRPRAEPAPRKRVEAPPAICPSCFMQLPASGRCDTCA